MRRNPTVRWAMGGKRGSYTEPTGSPARVAHEARRARGARSVGRTAIRPAPAWRPQQGTGREHATEVTVEAQAHCAASGSSPAADADARPSTASFQRLHVEATDAVESVGRRPSVAKGAAAIDVGPSADVLDVPPARSTRSPRAHSRKRKLPGSGNLATPVPENLATVEGAKDGGSRRRVDDEETAAGGNASAAEETRDPSPASSGIEREREVAHVDDRVETRARGVGRPSNTEAFRPLVKELLAGDAELITLEILRRAKIAGYTGSKTALYALVAQLPPADVRPVVRFGGVAGEFAQRHVEVNTRRPSRATGDVPEVRMATGRAADAPGRKPTTPSFGPDEPTYFFWPIGGVLLSQVAFRSKRGRKICVDLGSSSPSLSSGVRSRQSLPALVRAMRRPPQPSSRRVLSPISERGASATRSATRRAPTGCRPMGLSHLMTSRPCRGSSETPAPSSRQKKRSAGTSAACESTSALIASTRPNFAARTTTSTRTSFKPGTTAT